MKKQNLKSNSAITLVALIITVIVLLILATVSISLIINSGIITKSKEAVDKYSYEEGLEQIKLAYQEWQMSKYMGTTENVKDFIQHKLEEMYENVTVTQNSETEIFPLLISLNGKDFIFNADGTSRAKYGIDEYDVAKHPETYYGKYVTNYNSPNDAGINASFGKKWQIFLADDTNIYLIASNSVNKEYVSLNYNYNENKPDKMWFTNILGEYDTTNAGNKSVSTILGKLDKQSRYHQWLNSAPLANLANQKAVLSMLDTDKWNEYIDGANKRGFKNSQFAEYVIGGPTIEMFCDSYNVTHEGDNIIAKSKDSLGEYYTAGYKIKKGSSDEADSVENLKVDSQTPVNSDVNNMYFKCSYWLSSPSAYGRTRLIQVYGNNCGAYYDYDFYNISFRPLVCLKPNVHLVENEDGQTYSLELN